jgi:16S rRNA (cytidine1402-2'-O)-methyltransferase
VIAFESPRRLAATLELFAERAPARPIAVCRELTKLHEEVRRGPAAELAAHYREHSPRGEIVLVIGRGMEGNAGERMRSALAALAELVDAGAKPRRAAGAVAGLAGLGVNALYSEWMSRAKQTTR